MICFGRRSGRCGREGCVKSEDVLDYSWPLLVIKGK